MFWTTGALFYVVWCLCNCEYVLDDPQDRIFLDSEIDKDCFDKSGRILLDTLVRQILNAEY